MTMDETKILEGHVLVRKGALKINSSLPEVGLKDVTPNGSWVEQKQVQAALDNRKQLIELERIEKSGALSHAVWREDLMLAEVTQKVGSYWQYIGHNVGKQLFLHPEEALYLMEVNCLLLLYDDIKVSLQQAYALLLRGKISLLQYKVYASLSRLGYRVYRHRMEASESTQCEKLINLPSTSKENIDKTPKENCHNTNDHGNDRSDPTVLEINDNVIEMQDKTHLKPPDDTSDNQPDVNLKRTVVNKTAQASSSKKNTSLNKSNISNYIQHKIQKLKSRKYKTTKSTKLRDCFENIPKFTDNPVISIVAPESRYLPGNIKLKCSSYILTVEKMRTKSTTPEVIPTTSNIPDDSMNTAYASNVRRIYLPPVVTRQNWINSFNFRIAPECNVSRNSNFWRSQPNLNYFQYTMTFQRPFIYPQFGPRIIMQPFMQPVIPPNVNEGVNLNSTNHDRGRKRPRDQSKREHFDSIQKFATIVKKSILELKVSDQNVFKLRQLIQSYNTKFKARVRLSDDFTVINDENIVDTIELEDDDDQTSKKPKKRDSFNDKLQKLQQLAHKLKSLESSKEATSGHRRMFAKLMKRFNSSYNVDYYLNDNYDVINRNDLTLHSSSSDADEVAEVISQPTTSKKLKNPFSILKQISDKHKAQPCVNMNVNEKDNLKPFDYNPITKETFKNGWLPDISDFGRAEVISNNLAKEIIDIRKEEFLFDFMKIQPEKFKSWVDVKISFLQCLQETSELFNYGENRNVGPQIESLAKPEDFIDDTTVLKKLSIVQRHKEIDETTNIAVDFDVYNRDVQNFKKSNRPLPHFRVVCIKESSTLPSGANVASLHSKYKDNVTILFAVVGTGSISYLQVNPVDLPLYIPSNSNKF